MSSLESARCDKKEARVFTENYMEFLKDIPEQIMEVMAFQPGTLIPVHPEALVAMFLCMTFGYLLYVQALRIMVREKVDPYPLWLHCWMISIDITGSIMSWQCAIEHDFFWVFVLFGIGLPIWVCMEAICIFRSVSGHRQDEFGRLFKGEVTKKQAWTVAIGMIIVGASVNLWAETLLGGFENWCVFIIWPFTNYVFAYWTWRFWREQGLKNGNRFRNSMGLQWIITIQITLMWVPGLSWYLAVTPYLNTPAYYFCGIVASVLAIINLVYCSKLPNKEKLPNGKKPIW